MTDLHATAREFFENYEKANTDFDVERIGACYADTFLFGGPVGVQSIKKDDFLKVLPRRKEFFQSMGLTSSTVESFESSQLDSKYMLAKAVWRMQVARQGADPRDVESSATYVLSRVDNRFEIVFQIDHQDLMQKIQEPA